MRQSGVRPVVRVEIDLDDSPLTTRTYVSGDVPLLGHQPLVAKIQAITPRIDPITRRAQAGETSFVLKDGLATRDLVENNPLKGRWLRFYLGCPALTTASDWLQIGAGMIDDVIPARGRVSTELRVLDVLGLLVNKKVAGEWIAMHPLEAIEDLLLEMGVDADVIDTATLQGSAYATSISHYKIVRAFYDSSGDQRGIETPEPALGVIDELAQVCNGSISLGTNGKIRFGKYDHAAAVVKTWTKANVRGMRQTETTKRIFNKASMLFGWSGGGEPITSLTNPTSPDPSNGEGEYRYKVEVTDDDAIARYKFDATGQEFSAGFTSKWFGNRSQLDGSITSGAASFVVHTGWIKAWCGTGSSHRAASAARPIYLKIEDEIIKCDAVALDTDVESIPPGTDEFGNNHGTTGDDGISVLSQGINSPPGTTGGGGEVMRATMTVAASGRGVLGTTAAAHGDDAEVVDVTMAVNVLLDTIGRASDGLNIIEVDVVLHEIEPEIGDNIGLTHDAFLAYGYDGLAGTEKWEVVGKNVDPLAGFISYTLASVRTPPAVTSTWKWPGTNRKVFGALFGGWRGLYNMAIDEDIVASHVKGGPNPGMRVTSPSGLNIVISAGTVIHQGIRREVAARSANYALTASKDTYIWWDTERGVYVRRQVANGAAMPNIPSWGKLIAKCVTSGAAVTSITHYPKYRGIKGSRVQDFGVKSRNVDRHTVWAPNYLCRNADFGSAPEDDEQTDTAGQMDWSAPPDGWEMVVGTWNTDAAALVLNALSGSNSLVLANTAVATALNGPVFPVRREIAGEKPPYRFGAKWKGTTTSAVFTMKVFWYQDADLTASAVKASDTIINALSPTAADTFQVNHLFVAPPSDALFARIKIEKSSVTVGVSVARVIAEMAPSMFHVNKGGADQASVGTAETLITWSSQEYNVGADFDLATELYTAPRPGMYKFGVGVAFESVPDATLVEVYLKKSGTVVKVLGRSASSFTATIQICGEVEIALLAGETIGVYATTSGAARTVEGLNHYTYFWGREILQQA